MSDVRARQPPLGERQPLPGRPVGKREAPRGAAAAGIGYELLLVALAAAAYVAIRAVTEGRTEIAERNGHELVRLQERLGIAWEGWIQSLVLGRDWAVAACNWIYIYGHWPVIASVAVLLFRTRRDRYRLLRNAVFVSGAIGFLFFAFLPVAPPRLLDLGLVDTVAEQSTSYRALQPPELTNQYAAVPSLHFGWNLLVGVVLFRTTRQAALRTFAILMPAAMAFAVVATANHFILDVLTGGLIALIGLAAVRAKAAPRTILSSTHWRSPPSRPLRRHRPVSRGPEDLLLPQCLHGLPTWSRRQDEPVLRKTKAAVGSLVFLLVAPGVIAGVVPWWLTGWRLEAPLPYWLPLRVGGLVLLLAGVVVLLQAFARFVVEGVGTPAPVAPTERLVVGGLYRHVRNPMYLAVAAMIVGQALALGQPILIVYAAAFAVAVAAFVHWYEEPTLRRQFGEQYERYLRAVPAWWPRREPWETDVVDDS